MTRKVGRPTGTGHPDTKYLDRMADALTRDPDKSINSVIIAIARKDQLPKDHDEAFRQRLHRKWRKQGPQRLAEARQRHEERNRPATRTVDPTGIFSTQTIRAMEEAYNSPELRAARELADSHTIQAIRNHMQSPTMRAMRDQMNSPTIRAMRDQFNSPTMQAMRELAESPAIRAARALRNPFDD